MKSLSCEANAMSVWLRLVELPGCICDVVLKQDRTTAFV